MKKHIYITLHFQILFMGVSISLAICYIFARKYVKYERSIKYDGKKALNALIEWTKTASFPEQVMLSEAENIFDVKRYVQANLSDIAAHYPDEFYLSCRM